ncbi:hypothetical protein TNCV_3011861 [Trichonephila clavipes]|nr:hypothetical protein TNCV_3011861 [Trichonephila clavipes]
MCKLHRSEWSSLEMQAVRLTIVRYPCRRAASPLVRLVKAEERWEAPDHHQDVFPQNCSRTDQNHAVTCMLLKAKTNNRRENLALGRDEFCGF